MSVIYLAVFLMGVGTGFVAATAYLWWELSKAFERLSEERWEDG